MSSSKTATIRVIGLSAPIDMIMTAARSILIPSSNLPRLMINKEKCLYKEI